MDTPGLSNMSEVQQWNDEIANKYIWNTIILAILLVVGVVGNGIVILVYGFKMREDMDDRFFIPALAVVDFVATIVVCILSLNESVYPVTRQDVAFCKIMNYLSYFVASDSLFLLVIIAMQRYLKICRPFGYQIGLKTQRISVIGVTAFSLLLFLPLTFLYQIVPVTSPEGYTGTICTVLRQTRQATLVSYQIFVFVLYTILIIIMTVLYIFVAKQILKTTKLAKKRQMFPIPVQRALQNKCNAESSTDGASGGTGEFKQRGKIHNKGKKHLITNRYSYIFMIITLKSCLAFIGPVVFSALVKDTEAWTEDAQQYTIIRKLFLISPVTNPIIYGVFDTKFKTALKSLISLEKSGDSDSG